MPETVGALSAAGELLKAAEHGGPFLFIARMAMLRALTGDGPGIGPPPEPPTRAADQWKAKRASLGSDDEETTARAERS